MTGCAKCFETGSMDAGTDARGVPLTKPCACQIARDIVRNVNSAWPGLSLAPKVPSSPLSDHKGGNLYVTATDGTLRAHLRHVGLRAGPYWYFKVSSDSDLMTAWLAPVGLLGKEILDPDAASVSTEKATLVDLVEPPELLILRLGVKSARNSAMNEVLLEVLYHRSHIGKPTWLVDQPTRRFDPSHIAFSEDALHHITSWDHVVLDELPSGLTLEMRGGTENTEGSPPSEEVPARGPMTLSAGYASPGASASHTMRVDRPVADPPKRKFKRSSD